MTVVYCRAVQTWLAKNGKTAENVFRATHAALTDIQKITPEATHSFFYDGWMLMKEVIASTNGTTTIVEYHLPPPMDYGRPDWGMIYGE